MNRERESTAPQDPLANALASLRSGNGVLVVDDAGRENEGDLVFPAETLTVPQMAMQIRECSGLDCLCLPPEKAAALRLDPMVTKNTSRYGTAFTCSIEAASGVTTGVSAHDRVVTVRTAVARDAKPDELNRPGHVFPLVAKPGGVLERNGHTEATVDLMVLAGLSPAGVLCELTMPDGRMAKMADIEAFSRRENIPVVSVEDIVARRRQEEHS